MTKKTKVALMTGCLELAEDWGKRAVNVRGLVDDKEVSDQQQIKAVNATARTYEKCALELAAVLKEE